MDFEIAHINLSSKSEAQNAAELAAIRDRNLNEDEGAAGCPREDDKPIVDWHTDSYPFVCVTMLSDCTTMVGGETALRTGDGKVLKVRGPQMVCSGHHQTMIVRSNDHFRDVPSYYKAATLNIKLFGLSVPSNASHP